MHVPESLTRVDTIVPTAVPANGRIVIRRLAMACRSWGLMRGVSSASDPNESRRNSAAFKGDSYLMGVLDRGFDRGREARSSTVRNGVPSREEV